MTLSQPFRKFSEVSALSPGNEASVSRAALFAPVVKTSPEQGHSSEQRAIVNGTQPYFVVRRFSTGKRALIAKDLDERSLVDYGQKLTSGGK